MKFIAHDFTLLCMKFTLPNRETTITCTECSGDRGCGCVATRGSSSAPQGLFARLSIYLSINLSICLFVCLPVYLSVCLPVCLAVYLSICLPVCRSACLSACQSVCNFSFYPPTPLLHPPTLPPLPSADGDGSRDSELGWPQRCRIRLAEEAGGAGMGLHHRGTSEQRSAVVK
jgi:hypothetical protein